MEASKKYFQDKLILLLVSSNIFLAFMCIAVIFLRLGQGGGEGYIVEYRSNLGISAFTRGNIAEILSFVGFALLIAVLNTMLSIRVYQIRRVLSLLALGSGILLLVFAIIVSNALLVLR
jgi:hypothetical protein